MLSMVIKKINKLQTYASISIICGGASPGVEPIAANSYTTKHYLVHLM